jgi:hypothetical protein
MKKNLLFIFILLLNGSAFLSAQVTFQKAYGGFGIEGAWSVRQTSDGGYVMTAESTTYASSGDAIYIVKVDSIGVVQWSKSFSGSSGDTDYGNMVQQTFDGGYIVTGITRSFGSGNGDMCLVRLDAAGNFSWEKTYGGIDTDEGFSVQQTSDTGFVVAGYTKSFGSGAADCYLVKTDSLGNVQWSRTYGGIANEGVPAIGNISVHQTLDGGYIIADYTNSFGAGGYDFYLIRTDATGAVTWSKTYGGTEDEYGYGNNLGQLGDGGYIITGYTFSFGSGNADVYLVKTNGNGNVLWSKTYGGALDDYGYAVQQTPDGGFIINGSTRSFSANGQFDMYLIKTDLNGNLLWSKTYGGNNQDNGYAVEITSDGGYVATGYTHSFGAGQYDIYLVKTDANGYSGCNEGNPATIVTTPATIGGNAATLIDSGCTVTIPAAIQGSGCVQINMCAATDVRTIERDRGISVFPNPSNGIFTIDVNAEIDAIEIYNVLGEQVLTKTVNANQLQVDLSTQPAGVYFIQCISGNKIITREKLVIR